MTDLAPAIVTAVSTVAGALGALFLAGHNDTKRDLRAARREEKARQDSFAERLEESRHSFQRDTLLEIQDQLQRMVRLTAQQVMADMKTLKASGQLFQLPEGLSEEMYENGIAVRRLIVRVLDDDLRQSISDLYEYCVVLGVQIRLASLPPARAIGVLESQMAGMTEQYKAVNEQLGVLLRRELDRRFLVST